MADVAEPRSDWRTCCRLITAGASLPVFGHQYSSKVQQRDRHSAMFNELWAHSSRLNEAQRGACRDFASKGLGVRVPLAPPISPCQANFITSWPI
jgi:hypothetical protein